MDWKNISGLTMTEPKTPQQLNEAVMMKLDLDCTCHIDGGDECPYRLDFENDPAAAMWALEWWTQSLKPAEGLEMTKTPTLRCYPRLDGPCVWELQFGKLVFRGTFTEAICRAIVEAWG